MTYLLESKLPENKSIFFALRYIFGIGKSRSVTICKKLGFAPNLKVKDLSNEQVMKILKISESLNFLLASNLRRVKLLAIQRLVSIRSYRGLRRKKGFPVRGQRTHTNARTARRIR